MGILKRSSHCELLWGDYVKKFQEPPANSEYQGKEGHIPKGQKSLICVRELQRGNLFKGLAMLVA